MDSEILTWQTSRYYFFLLWCQLRCFFVSDLKARKKKKKLQARKVRTRKIACMKVVN